MLGTEKDRHMDFYSNDWHTWSDPSIPEYFNATTYLIDRHSAGSLARKRAIICDDEELTYTDLEHCVCRAAHGICDAGLRPDERLLMFASDSIEFIAMWLGAIRCGVVPVTVSDRYKAPLLEYFLWHTGAKGVFIDDDQLEKLADISDRLPESLEHVIVRGNGGGGLKTKPAITIWTYAQLTGGKDSSFQPRLRHKHDISYFFYSGGTTGMPKGIVHTSVDFLLIPERQGRFLEYGQEDIVHATSKKYFTHGLWPGVLMPLYWGATSLLTKGKQDGASVLSLVEEYKATRVITVPAVIRELVATARGSNEARQQFSTVKILCCASEKLPTSLCDEFFDIFDLEIFDAIGSAEVTYQWIGNRPAEWRRASLGKPIFGYHIKLIDDQGREIVEPNQSGDAWVKSETGLLCYWRDFGKTRDTTNGWWFRTGDKLMFDEDGFFWFVGRADDLFKIGGLWVSPIEVEAAIAKHPCVAECAVVAAEDSQGTIFVKAFIVLQKGTVSTEQIEYELKDLVREIGGYKIPRQIEYIDQLPRTELRKVNRRALREISGKLSA